MTSHLLTRSFPSSDRTFERVVRALVAQSDSPADLLRLLRPLYPNVAASERELSEEPRVMYVYRDGAYVPEPAEAWWEEPGVGQARVDAATGLITDADHRWAGLMGATAASVVGRPFTDFVLPEAIPAATVAFASILETGEARSAALMRRADGQLITIEYHAVLEGDRVRVSYRPHLT